MIEHEDQEKEGAEKRAWKGHREQSAREVSRNFLKNKDNQNILCQKPQEKLWKLGEDNAKHHQGLSEIKTERCSL